MPAPRCAWPASFSAGSGWAATPPAGSALRTRWSTPRAPPASPAAPREWAERRGPPMHAAKPCLAASGGLAHGAAQGAPTLLGLQGRACQGWQSEEDCAARAPALAPAHQLNPTHKLEPSPHRRAAPAPSGASALPARASPPRTLLRRFLSGAAGWTLPTATPARRAPPASSAPAATTSRARPALAPTRCPTACAQPASTVSDTHRRERDRSPRRPAG